MFFSVVKSLSFHLFDFSFRALLLRRATLNRLIDPLKNRVLLPNDFPCMILGDSKLVATARFL